MTSNRVIRACYAVAGVLFASGLVHLAVLLATGDSWAGPVSLRKPMTFGLSFGLIVATLTWVSAYLPLRGRTRAWLLGVFTAASVIEVALITAQAWRGVPSHFNLSTPADAAIARVLAVGGGVLIAVIVTLTVASWRTNPATSRSMTVAVRAGLLALDAALVAGAAMIAAGMSRVAAGDQQGAYAAGGALKPAHAVTMQGVLVLPAIAWLLGRAAWPERLRLRVVWLAIAGYALLCAVVVRESLAAVNPMHAPAALTALAGVGALATAAAGVAAVAAARPALRRAPAARLGPPAPR